ncbi:MAG TPA: hypothetical protein VNA19_17925 [Pyrinomonadaceae bacterium]|jgi:hypothetical protein|nr:hypothetical protein [Pyrinomonadaceae bacterium]
MPLVKASDFMPPENEQVLVYDERNRRLEFGRYVRGRWYLEDSQTGELREIAPVTHWGPVLDSEDYDPADDD